MDLENQARIKDLAEKYGKDDLVVVLGGAEAEASGLAAETVSAGDPTFAGPLAGVQLGLKAYHIFDGINHSCASPVNIFLNLAYNQNYYNIYAIFR